MRQALTFERFEDFQRFFPEKIRQLTHLILFYKLGDSNYNLRAKCL